MRRLALLVLVGLVSGSASATANVAREPRPPNPHLRTLGVTRVASLTSYCWSVPSHARCAVFEFFFGARPAQTLTWRAGVPITIDLLAPARRLFAEVVRAGTARDSNRLRLRPRRIDATGRRWRLRIPARSKPVTDLAISADFDRFGRKDRLSSDIGLRRR